MVKCQLKGLCYNCDEKYFHGKEQKFFIAIFEDIVEGEDDVSPMEEIPPTNDTTPSVDPLEVEPMFLLHALTIFSSPQPSS
jgi:hypothetical protein